MESLRRFTEIKQVSTRTIQVCRVQWGSCLEHLCFKCRTSLHCQKVREIPGYGWTHLRCQEKCMLPIVTVNQSACFSFSTANYCWKPHEIRWFHSTLHHQIAECTWACPTPWELVFPLKSHNHKHEHRSDLPIMFTVFISCWWSTHGALPHGGQVQLLHWWVHSTGR